MSDLSDLDDLPHALPRPVPPRTWRERLDDLVAASELTPARIGAAVAVLAVVGFAVWRLAAPPAPPPEMQLPFAEGSAATSAGVAATPDAAGGAGSPAGGSAAPTATGGGEGSSGAAGDAQVVVHVAGAVAAPGVQRLPAGARVVDAVDAAGGAAADADLARINLAAALVDGQQVYVVRVGEDPPPPPAGAPAGGGAAGEGAGPAGLVDVNSASASELDELPGVGPATAEAIISHREQHGAFLTVDDLLDVRGIGDAKLEQLRDLVTV